MIIVLYLEAICSPSAVSKGANHYEFFIHDRASAQHEREKSPLSNYEPPESGPRINQYESKQGACGWQTNFCNSGELLVNTEQNPESVFEQQKNPEFRRNPEKLHP